MIDVINLPNIKPFYSLEETSKLLSALFPINYSVKEILTLCTSQELDLFVNTQSIGFNRISKLKDNKDCLKIFLKNVDQQEDVKSFFFKGGISTLYFFNKYNEISTASQEIKAKKFVFNGYFMINKALHFYVEKNFVFSDTLSLRCKGFSINGSLLENATAICDIHFQNSQHFIHSDLVICAFSIQSMFFNRLKNMNFFSKFMFFLNLARKTKGFDLSKHLPLNESEFMANSFDNRIKNLDELEDVQETIEKQAKRIAELEAENLTKHHPPENKINDTIEATNRVTRPQRLLFSLLVAKNYNDFDTRNSLFEAINSDLKSMGLTTADIKADTFYRLIDDDLPANKKIFPNKQ